MLGLHEHSQSPERRQKEAYDHHIALVDHTTGPERQTTSSPPAIRTSTDNTSTASDLSRTHTRLGRKWTLREELARRKYSKWQEKEADLPRPSHDEKEAAESRGRPASKQKKRSKGKVSGPALRPHDRRRSGSAIEVSPASTKVTEEIDVLHENQRGSFFCGIPLFSHKSLLNFDPSPWTNAAFKNSPVNITNAQVPDPSWRWEWKSWYVDMSADVDDQGWQYSFSFSPAFSWHGRAIWFDSFVRRRRWLRKRVRRTSSPRDDSGSRHRQPLRERMLNSEYFTVQPPRSQSVSSRKTTTERSERAESLDRQLAGVGTDPSTEKISDLTSLMSALKSAKIDREKVEAVDQYLQGQRRGLDELADKVYHSPQFSGKKGNCSVLFLTHTDSSSDSGYHGITRISNLTTPIARPSFASF